MPAATPFLEVADALKEYGAHDLDLCYQCSTCTGSCPWSFVEPLHIRKLIHMAQLGLPGYEGEDLWKCTTCASCQVRCPRGVAIVDLVRSTRAMIGETGLIPQSLRSALGSVKGEGNPWNGKREERNAWTESAGIPRFDPSRHEYLLSACCMSSYDKRSRRIADALWKVLQAGGVTAGVLGAEESCCGEAVRKIGDEPTFQSLGKQNAAAFEKAGVRKVIALSPHCYHTFKNEYADFGSKLEVLHASEVIQRLLFEGRIKPAKKLDLTVTWHDPCYLGRHNDVFDAPREVLRALPGVTFREMFRNKKQSLCCGGGGGRMWMETKRGERFSDLRLPEALAVGATVLATGCPYCVNMFEDSRLGLEREDAIQVRDLAELVAETL